MATTRTREYAKALNQQQAAEGLEWSTPRGKVVAHEIRAYKARVSAYMLERGMSWGEWNGRTEGVFEVVAVDWDFFNDCEGGALFDAIHSKIIGGLVAAYKSRVEAYQVARGLSWAHWCGNTESVFHAVPFDWGSLDDSDGVELFDAIARKVEHEDRKLAA